MSSFEELSDDYYDSQEESPPDSLSSGLYGLRSSSSTLSNVGGYDCNFTSELNDTLKCQICLSVAKDPLQEEQCGKLFCQDCVFQLERGGPEPCPNCRTSFPRYFKDKRSNKFLSYVASSYSYTRYIANVTTWQSP